MVLFELFPDVRKMIIEMKIAFNILLNGFRLMR